MVASAEPERVRGEPPIALVQKWAAQAAGVRAADVRSVVRGPNRAAWLPTVDVRFQQATDYDQKYGSTDGQTFAVDDVDTGWGRQVVIQARWELDGLVHDSDRVRARAEARAMVRLRQRVQSEVTRVYFARHRLQMLVEDAPLADPTERRNQRLRIAELTAELDTWTDGRFSEGR